MAKKVIGKPYYTFVPATRTITLQRVVNRENLFLITNTSTNTVIYNFSDPTLNTTRYLNYVSPGFSWEPGISLTINQIVGHLGRLYVVTTGGLSGTVAPIHTSGSVTATGGAAVLEFLKSAPPIGQEETIIVLSFNTASMSANDDLQFVLDQTENEIIPVEAYRDPVSKFRVSTAQSLIDTDFEYGSQPTKWETLSLVNNRPFAFFDVSTPLPGITNISTAAGNPTRTFTVTHSAVTYTVGSPIFLQGNTNPSTNGWFSILTATSGSFTVQSDRVLPANTSFFDASKTFGYLGTYYSGAVESGTAAERNGIQVSLVANTAFVGSTLTMTSGASTGTTVTVLSTANLAYGAFPTITAGTGAFAAGTFVTGVLSDTQFTINLTPSTPLSNATITVPLVTITTVNAHGLYSGNKVSIRATTASGNPPNGDWIVASTPTANTAVINVLNAPSGGNITPAALSAYQTLRTINSSTSFHRPFDGGVGFTIGTIPAAGNQLIRQTRRYFRYQSGKGIQFSTGTMLKPVIPTISLTASGTTVTVTTTDSHNLFVGAQVRVFGALDNAYNGLFTVSGVPSLTSFTYNALTAPATSPDNGFPINVAPHKWSGSATRLGLFDDQNGIFFEYDGSVLYAVVRKSVDQISGTVSLTPGSSTVTGTSTRFTTQVRPHSMINLRGMAYRVLSVENDTTLRISPEYRGFSAITTATASVTVEKRIPQQSWNIDKCDGTGPSKYVLDLSRIQMFYIDYSWYGAGAVRWGFKDQLGDVKYVHKEINAGVQTEAYMRSGNLPARYEVGTGTSVYSILAATLSSADTNGLVLRDASLFPDSGNLIISGGTATAPMEYVRYSSKVGNTLNGLTRAIAGGNIAPQTWTFSNANPIGVLLTGTTFNPTVSHWGSSVMMDGRFDDDKQFVFQAGMTTSITTLPVAATTRHALLSIRLSPSVDSGLTSNIGVRELINRMQLTMQQTDIAVVAGAANTIVRIELILNGRFNNPGAPQWTAVGGSSLAQVMFHPTTATFATVVGGESIYSFFVTVPTNQTGYLTQDLTKVRDLGNSILGGGSLVTGTTTSSTVYPDGPDILTITASVVAGAANATTVNSRIAWTEAQA